MTSKIENEAVRFRSGRFILLLFAIIALAILYSPRLFGGDGKGNSDRCATISPNSQIFPPIIKQGAWLHKHYVPKPVGNLCEWFAGKVRVASEANSDGMKRKRPSGTFLTVLPMTRPLRSNRPCKKNLSRGWPLGFAYDPSRGGRRSQSGANKRNFWCVVGRGYESLLRR